MIKGLIGVAIDDRKPVASGSNPSRITGLKRGNLSLRGYGNPVLAEANKLRASVETIYPASQVDGERVQACQKRQGILRSGNLHRRFSARGCFGYGDRYR